MGDYDEYWCTVFWINLTKSCECFQLHLNNVSTRPCKLQNTYRARAIREINSRIYPTLTVASEFTRFEYIWLQREWNTAREGVQNTYHWSGPIDDTTDEWLPQWRLTVTWSSWTHSVLSRCFSSSRSPMDAAYIYSCRVWSWSPFIRTRSTQTAGLVDMSWICCSLLCHVDFWVNILFFASAKFFARRGGEGDA